MARNHYIVLGVSRSESAAGIRAAFRDLVKRHHPDRSGAASSDELREILEAYAVLSDPDRRRRYNHSIGDPQAVRHAGEWPDAEPLVPEAASIFSRADAVGPSFAETWERWARNFTGLDVSKAERAQAIDVELILDPEEARRGVAVPLGIPVLVPCPSCEGTGGDRVFPCVACDASGLVEGRRTVSLSVPPGLPGGLFELRLDAIGIRNFVLRALVRVGHA